MRQFILRLIKLIFYKNVEQCPLSLGFYLTSFMWFTVCQIYYLIIFTEANKHCLTLYLEGFLKEIK